jgi:hypothetical protein
VAGNLIAGHVKSCGCYRKKITSERESLDLNGKTFGHLTVIKKLDKKIGLHNAWLCKCICGKVVEVRAGGLSSGNNISCGCKCEENKRSVNIRNKYKKYHKPPGEANFNHIYASYISGARRRNLAFELNKEQFRELTSKNCFYCNLPPKQKMKNSANTGEIVYNGLDRVDNTKGYTIDNVVPCCKKCNHAKDISTLSDFKTWVKSVYQNMNLDEMCI